MNFKIGRFFYLFTSFIIGFFFLAVGILCMTMPFSDLLKGEVALFILDDNLILPLFGLGLILIGVSLLIYTILNSRHRYIHIHTGTRSVTLDEDLIQHYLDTYWEELFPKLQIPSQFKIKKDAIQIKADLPYLPPLEQKQFLEQTGKDLKNIFNNVLGYQKEIHLIASFQPRNDSEKV